MNRKDGNGRAGFTLLETILVLAIAGILAALLVVGIGRIARQAYLGRVNDSAEVVYMAMQSAVTDLKAQGRFDEVFSDEFLGDPHHGAPDNPKAEFYAVPDSVIDGTASVPGVTGALGEALSADERKALKDTRSIVYMVLNRDDSGTVHKDSALLKELLDPYISDKSIFNYSILVEINRSNRTVRAAFFSEKTPEFKYAAAPDEALQRDRSDVYYRDRELLDEKGQGYYGTLASGMGESISRLDHAFVKIYNDDMLTVEWGEFTPASAGTWNEKKKVLSDMTYDLYIVNAVDTTKVYYKIEDITAYEDGADYITYQASGGTNTVVSGTDKFIGNTYYGTTRLPVYDLFSWNDIAYGVKPDLAVSSFTTFQRDAGAGSLVEMTPSMKHRISYLPGTESGVDGAPGSFRLVLDSITEAGHDGLSVSNVYPEIPWNENFKVIVEGKYQGEGFTGSMVVSGDVANAYTESKGLYSVGAGNISTTTDRGVNAFMEFVHHIMNRLPRQTTAPDSHWWYEVSYARHLNNLRYLISDNAAVAGSSQGKYQNFLVSRDIDWSLQQIGRMVNGDDGSVVHRVTTANTTSDNLSDTDVEKLKVFVPLSTEEADEKDGFSGLIQSERFENDGRQKIGSVTISGKDMDVYEPHKIYGLKIAKYKKQVSGRAVIPDTAADRVGLFETVSSDGEVSHLTLSGVTVVGGEDIGAFSGTFYGNGTELTVSSDQDIRKMKAAVQKADGTWDEAEKGDLKPWLYPASSVWKGNHIEGENRVGGLFGKVEKHTTLFADGDHSGLLKNLANGTVFVDHYLDTSAALPELNGISVTAKNQMAGGIAGHVNAEAKLEMMTNTGSVTAGAYAGGIAGAVGESVSLSGADPDPADGQYLVVRYNDGTGAGAGFNTAEYQNYGVITAKIVGSAADTGSYAGGIAGAADTNTGITGRAVIRNMRNAGYVLAEKNCAGGIAGNIERTEIYNAQNGADIQAWDSYAGGVVGAASDKSLIEGAQNLKPGGDKAAYGNIYYTNTKNGARIYGSKRDDVLFADGTAAPSGITAVSYAGGIAGMLDDDVRVNALSYNMGTQPEDEFAKAHTSSAGTENQIILNRRNVKEEAVIPGETEQVMPLVNYWQVTGVGSGPGTSADASRYIGGIAGLIQGKAALNDYSYPNSSAPGEPSWTMRVAVKNRGNITARYGSYAGGIAGAAANEALICNPENGRAPGTAAGYEDTVIQAFEYTGGVAGAVNSEAALGTGTTGAGVNNKMVRILSNRIPVEVLVSGGGVESYDYRTNRAGLVVSERGYAGGIAGYIDTMYSKAAVTNAFNGGDVQAEFKAGGLFGEVAGRTETAYDWAVLEKRLLRGTEDPYMTNSGNVTVSGDIAGGIAGQVSSPEVKLRDVFNSGAIEAGGSYAGGIAGYVVTRNPGIDDAGGTIHGIIRNTDPVLVKIILASGGITGQLPVYNNSGTVLAKGSCAGGIIGKATVSLKDMFNTGEIRAGVAFAGGLVGKLEYNMGRDPEAGDPEGDDPQIDGALAPDPGEAIVLATTLDGTRPDTGASFDVVNKMYTDTLSGAGKRDLLFHNRGNVATEQSESAGGIVGSAVREEKDATEPAIEVRDLYNAGHVVAGLTSEMKWEGFDDESIFGVEGGFLSTYSEENTSSGGIIGRARGLVLHYDAETMISILQGQESLPRESKFLPNMGSVYARNEAGGLIGSAAGAGYGQTDVLIENGANRGIVRAQEESAGGLLGEGIRSTIRSDVDVAETMIEIARNHNTDQDDWIFSNLGRIIAGTNNAGGIAGKLESGIITDVFNQGNVRADMDNAGGIVGYAVEKDRNISTVISHSKDTAERMFGDTEPGRYIFTNTASVKAGGSNAGGIVGKAIGKVDTKEGYYADLEPTDKKLGKVVLTDVYSGDTSTKDASGVGGTSYAVEIEANYNAGGVAGRFVDAVLVNENTAETALGAGIYTNNAIVTAKTSNAGGIIGNADARTNNDTDIREYDKEPEKMKQEVDSNHFLVADVYNIGKITAGNRFGDGFNAGGIFGIAGAGSYVNNPELVTEALGAKMLTNKGSVSAGNNAGGVFGAVTAKFDTSEYLAADNAVDFAKLGKGLFAGRGTRSDVLDVFNGGNVEAAGGSNAGGIAGLAVHLDLRYSEDILKETGHGPGNTASPGNADRSAFVAVNSASVKAGRDNAGGVIGNGYQCILQDVFNTADKSLDEAKNNADFRILASNNNAGGIIGKADGLKLFYSDMVCSNIENDRDYVYSNVANIQAGRDNAGGIAGYAANGIELLDSYNMGAVKAGGDNAGGLVGYLYQNRTSDRDGQPAVVRTMDTDPLSQVSPEKNETLIRSNDRTLDEDGKKPYRGEDFITYDKSVSYITYTTIVTGEGEAYKIKDASGNTIYTNRYSSAAKPAVTGKYHIMTGGSNAGGIVGYARAPKPQADRLVNKRQMRTDAAILRVENVFHTGRPEAPGIGGVWAKKGNAGGIIGTSEYAHLTYSFDVNPGPGGLDVGGTGNAGSKGDHSVMTEAFNDPRVIKDPYAISNVGLHMIANSANVWASDKDPETGDGGLLPVDSRTGEFYNRPGNAGGAIGYMRGGRAERLYSLKGSVMAPSNLGGVVGYATDDALIRQASRMGAPKEEEGNAYADVQLDGNHILAGTEGTKRRGSIRVGGIVGYADNGTQVMDVRNMARVEGRAYVGGIVGQTGSNVKITLAHNMEAVIGRVNSPEDQKDLITVDQMNDPKLDRSAVDGCYIGGIVGKAGTGGGEQEFKTGTVIKMVKNDPLLTHNFEEHLTKNVNGREKDIGGGNLSNQVDGRRYVGGITGARGIINYAVNTGQVSGVQYIGGMTGQGYRITNSFNTANVEAENNYLYLGAETPVFSQAVFVGGIAGQLGSRNGDKLQAVDAGSYIKNCYNASSRVNGASIVGGITGYAIAPVDRTYNSATVSSEQYNRGNSDSEPIEIGNKIGGIVGQIAQDRKGDIRISDSYNSGAVGGTGDAGGILGFIEYYADGEIINAANGIRVENSYFIKDNSVRYYNALSSQITTDINATLRALRLESGFPIEHFVAETATSSNLQGEAVQDSDYGARNYSNMIFNGYTEYRNAVVGPGGAAADAGLSGTTDLQTPLNKDQNWRNSDRPILQESGTDMNGLQAAKFVFPYNGGMHSDGGEADTGDEIMIGRDYEFLHLDFSGTDTGNENRPPDIWLDPDETELENSNQYFSSVDNTELSTLYNVWPTKVIDYMKVDAVYNDGGSAEDTKYRNNGTGKIRGTQKAILAGQVNAIGMPLWKVNYNYAAAGGTGSLVRGVPTSVYTPETLTLTGRFSEHGNKMPRIMKFNIFDGYSRGEYSYDNEQFTVKLVENQIQKAYVMVREDEWNFDKATSSDATPVEHKVVEYQDSGGSPFKYYFYVENQGALNNADGIGAQDILNLIDVELRRVEEADGKTEIEWMIRLPSVEMDTYMAAKSGFFTAEAVKVYDNADKIERDDFTAEERTSRMFNMHFANYYGSKDPATYPAGRDPNHNRSIFEEYPDMDLDEFPDGNVTRSYPVNETAALGSVKLHMVDAESGEYAEKVKNRLQIANERHLYNLNKNQNQGTEEIDSYLPYITREVQLIRDIELSTDPATPGGEYNCFVIGLSKGSFKRMTGSIDGTGEDGKTIHTIGNLQVDMAQSVGLPAELGRDNYGLIYDLSGGVVKNLQIGGDSRIVSRRTGALAFQASNGKTGENEINNPWHENLGPELPMEQGADAKIYNTRVNADISAQEAGGFVYETVRRFESSEETVADRTKRDALTITNSQFGGKINTIKGNAQKDRYVTGSLVSSGFLCRMQGGFDDNNILDSAARSFYPLNASINGSEVTEDAYIYAGEYASGIVGAVDNRINAEAQIATVRKSANNGTVVSTRRANGISQGIMDDGGTKMGESGVYVYSSYNNGIVQTPEETGLASGIGNVIRLASHAVNNGTVIGRIASGISNYGSGDMKLEQCSNNGYVEGRKIAGGIVAVPARWSKGAGMAVPYREEHLSLNLENCYNTGTVVVTTNEDNNTDVIDNSYAGGIIGLALLYDMKANWYETGNYLSEIGEDDRKTVLRNCYNAGRVYYKEGDEFSLNHRYIGGIAGGGLHRFVDIQNCYSLSDSEALPGVSVNRYRADVDLGNYRGTTPENWKETIALAEPADDKAYNYNLTAVGDMPYGTNVTTLPFADMLNLDNFTGFNADGETIWIIDHTTEDKNGYIYPFPQFAAEAGEQYVGDKKPAAEGFPDAVFNVDINLEQFHTNVPVTAREINISQVADKRLIPVQVSYSETQGVESLGNFDNMDGETPGSNSVQVVAQSRYTFTLDSPSTDYVLYVYDGDADAADYTPAMIRRYEVKNGVVASGGKLHDEQSVRVQPMQYFNTAPGGDEYARASHNALTIGDKEEIGWYMPIRGYYTVVAAERGTRVNVAGPGAYNSRVVDLAEGAATRGGIRAEDTDNSSERFQVHFSGNSIEERGGAYRSGSKDKPYEVVDQYGIIGMTTSGIAQKSTDRRYYSQVRDIVVREHAYSMFEFNGVYDGKKKDYNPAPGAEEPFMRGSYTLSYRTGQGDFGFINYLVPTNEALRAGFTPVVSNLNVYAQANGRYSGKVGRYLEAAGYYTALGLVADYAEYAKFEKVTTLGNVVYGGKDGRADRAGFFGDGSSAFGGIAGIAKNTVIDRAQNKATLGVGIQQLSGGIDGLKAAWTNHAAPAGGVSIAGIAAGAMSKGNAPMAGEIKHVSNNGELRASANHDVAGIVHTSRGAGINYAVNGGWVRAMNGTAAGLVVSTNSRLGYGYNSGLVTAGSVKGKAAGTAVGLFGSGSKGNTEKLYNAGIVRGNKQGAITRGSNVEWLNGKAYYLKDEKLYWMDPSSLPADMTIKAENGDKNLEMYLGFAFVPVELYGFTEDEAKMKGGEDPYIAGDPFALSYSDMRDKKIMDEKGFKAKDWEVREMKDPVKGPEADKTFYRNYGNDEYPLPQLKASPHLTRRNLNFPVFLGGSKEVAKVPYENVSYEDGGKMAKYVPLNTPDGGRDETFKDTISVDLNDFTTTSKYRILVYEGNPAMSGKPDSDPENDEIVYDKDRPPRLEITVQRRYVDTRDMTLDSSAGGANDLTPAIVGNSLNKQYGELLSNERVAYFYEVNVLDGAGKERPAVFETKEFLEKNSVNLLFNNDLLDSLEEPGFNKGSKDDAKYYSVTVIEEQTPVKGETTKWDEYYSRFSPHFANAVSRQQEKWEFGELEEKPYEIATQRNLYNIAKGTDATAYLGNHYRQTQDIRLSDKKTEAPIANGSPEAIKVSQAGTSASPIRDMATVMRKQEERNRLWTEPIGAVKAGITEHGFRGTYTAGTGALGNTPDAVTGGHKLVDTRTRIESAVFGRVAPQARITDVSYELRPTTVGRETEVDTLTVDPKVHALLVEENQGSVENILFANSEEDGNKKTVRLSRGTNPVDTDRFALVVGETSQKISDTNPDHVPAVRRVAVKDGYRVAPETAGNPAVPLVLGTIVGRTKGGVDLAGVESGADISLNTGGGIYSDAIIGMVIGEMENGVDGSGPVSLTKAVMTGTLEAYTSGDRIAGGIVGRISNSEVLLSEVKAGTPEADGKPETQIKLSSNVIRGADNITGGIVGTVQGGRLSLERAGSALQITSNDVNKAVIGGMIGSVGKSPETDDAAKVTIASASNAEIYLEDTGSGPGILGGVIGRVGEGASAGLEDVGTGEHGADDARYAIVMNLKSSMANVRGMKTAGGIIGAVEGPDSVVEMTDVINRLPILAEDKKGAPRYNLGGLIGYSKQGILYLHDTMPGEETNLINEGNVRMTNQNTLNNAVYASGGIGYLDDSPAQIAAFRNTGDVTVSTATAEGDAEIPAYSRSNVRLAGTIAYAEGALKGVQEDETAGLLMAAGSLTVKETLNTGAIRDERKMEDIIRNNGSSTASGIIAELDGAADTADTDDPVQIKFNHNAGEIRGIRAAGILTDISKNWKDTIKKSDDPAKMTAPLELKHNINISPIDAGYEDEEYVGISDDAEGSEETEGISHRITGSDITLVYELPLAKAVVEGEEQELDGYELAELMEEIRNAIPSNATPSDATPSDATPSDASPSDADPKITFYNAGLEDMVKAPDYESDSVPPETYADRVSGVILYLSQLQSYGKFKAATGWDDHVIGERPVIPVSPPKWIMEEGTGPGITENRYIPPGGISRLARAPALTQVDVVPVETLMRTWRLELIKAPPADDDDEPMEPDSEDMDLINDLDRPFVTATPSNATPPSATPSNATPSNATPSNASGDTFQVVETETTREMNSYELTWEYSGEIMDYLASASNAMEADIPEHEFVIVWEYGGRTVYLTETGVLTAEEDGIYHFTVTPEMIAEVTENLPPDEREIDVGISIAVLFEGRMYRGDPWKVTVEMPRASEDGSENAPETMPDINMADYSEALSYLVSYGLSRQGDPYSQLLAGKDDYVDCSYFVMDSYRQLGISLPRTAASQAQYLESRRLLVPKGQLMPGDLIYYSFQKNGRYKDVSHVAMYVGDGMIVDASSSRGEVVYRRIMGLDSIVLCARPLAIAGADSGEP